MTRDFLTLEIGTLGLMVVLCRKLQVLELNLCVELIYKVLT